jgi:hypothetical protein
MLHLVGSWTFRCHKGDEFLGELIDCELRKNTLFHGVCYVLHTWVCEVPSIGHEDLNVLARSQFFFHFTLTAFQRCMNTEQLYVTSRPFTCSCGKGYVCGSSSCNVNVRLVHSSLARLTGGFEVLRFVFLSVRWYDKFEGIWKRAMVANFKLEI